MSNVFSEYEYRELGFLFSGETAATAVACIGSVEETLGVKTVIKKCRGVVRKRQPRGTGEGTLKITGHWPYALYTKLFGMEHDSLASGVKGHGLKSRHPTVCVTADVYDEDDVEKFKAWPCCTVVSDLTRKTTNGEEEVAEVDLELAITPDDNGFGMYEALAEDLSDTIKGKWMAAFSAALVTATT